MVLALLFALMLVFIPTLAFASPDVPPSDGSFDSSALMAAFKAHQWVAVAAIVIGLLIRLQKSGKLPGFNKIPANYRPFLALGLGIASGVLDKIVVDSKSWRVAVLDGLLSAFIAIVAHDTIIEGVRNGKEVLGGGSVNPDPTPVVTSADALKKNGPSLVFLAFGIPGLLISGWVTEGCGFFTPANDIAIGKAACILEHAFLDLPALNSVCNLVTDSEKRAGAQLSAEHRAKVAEEMKAMRAEVCAPDAGPEAGGAK